MNRLYRDKSFFIISVMLGIVGLISLRIILQEFSPRDTVDIKTFPKAFGDWSSREIQIDEEEYELLETRNAFSREYFDSHGHQVLLFIIYSQSNRKVFHPPEICYTGGGATIINNELVKFETEKGKTIPVNRFLIELAHTQQAMYYWFKVGRSYTSNYWYQQILVSIQTFLGRHQGGAMIRITVPYNAEMPEKSFQAAEKFVKEILPLLEKYLP